MKKKKKNAIFSVSWLTHSLSEKTCVVFFEFENNTDQYSFNFITIFLHQRTKESSQLKNIKTKTKNCNKQFAIFIHGPTGFPTWQQNY